MAEADDKTISIKNPRPIPASEQSLPVSDNGPDLVPDSMPDLVPDLEADTTISTKNPPPTPVSEESLPVSDSVPDLVPDSVPDPEADATISIKNPPLIPVSEQPLPKSDSVPDLVPDPVPVRGHESFCAKRRCLSAFCLVLLIAMIVGVVTGVTVGGDTDNDDPTPATTVPPTSIDSIAPSCIAGLCQVGLFLDGGSEDGSFGNSVALSADGNRVAIGAPRGNNSSGYVRLLEWTGSQWVQLGSDLIGEASGDSFSVGLALSAYGNRVAIGAPHHDGNGDSAGRVLIFEWQGDQWNQLGSALDGNIAADRFGVSVTLSADGSRVAIGAPGDYPFGLGFVRIFDWVGSEWTQIGSDLEDFDEFGYSVALSADGNRVAIGAPEREETGDSEQSGYVRIFEWSGSQWVKVGTDLNGDESFDYFGSSVALSSNGNRVAIGAPSEGDGYVRIFDWSGSQWVQVGSDLDDEEAGYGFGSSVALSSDGNHVAIATSNYVSILDWSGSQWVQVGSVEEFGGFDFDWSTVALSSDGNRVAIGAVTIDNDDGVEIGQVGIFDFDTSAPTVPPSSIDSTPACSAGFCQVGLDLDSDIKNDSFGLSVAMSADGIRVAIGAPDDDANGNLAGHVGIFDWSGSDWKQVGSDLDGEEAGDEFGSSVAISADGNRVAIGELNGWAGHVRIFDWSGSTWDQVGSDLDGGPYDWFGSSVALSSDGNRVAIGAPDTYDEYGDGAGYVRILDWSGNQWIPVGADIDGDAARDHFGSSVALSSDGSRVAIGAPENPPPFNVASGDIEQTGYVSIFEWSGSQWVQVGLDLDGEAANDWFGLSVALSSDGNRVAIGAPSNDGGGENAGLVCIFDWSESQWVQVGSDLIGEAAGDEFGGSIALSSDGRRVVIGAAFNNGNGFDAGHVRIFDWSGNQWVQVGSDLDGEAAGDEFGRSVAISADGNHVAIGAHAGHVRIFDWF